MALLVATTLALVACMVMILARALLGPTVYDRVMAVNTFGGVLFLVIFFLRLFGQGMASHVAVVAMARWFVATRGRALAIATLGFTVGELVLPVSFVALMGVVDWRWLWVGVGLVALARVACGDPVSCGRRRSGGYFRPAGVVGRRRRCAVVCGDSSRR